MVHQRTPTISAATAMISFVGVPSSKEDRVDWLRLQFNGLSNSKIPRERRLQMICVMLWSSSHMIFSALFCYICSFPTLWPILIGYLIYMHVYDRSPDTGGHPSKSFKDAQFWHHFANYFPVSLVKTADLPKERRYVFGYHPHGIIGMGAMSNFAFNATGFDSLFPGIKPHLLTLTTNFNIPIYREILMTLGICSVARKSCQNILRKGPGYSIAIVVGGASESLSAIPGTADLTLRRRLGFIKLAVREGADLVPVFSFGENDLYAQLASKKGSKLRAMQKAFQQYFGFTLPIFHGRGLFNYSLGMLPFRHPIISVVGRPIHVEKCDKPSNELLLEYQEKYIVELTRIWDDHKDKYAPNRKRDLSIVE